MTECRALTWKNIFLTLQRPYKASSSGLPPPQTVRKVLTRLKYSVPLYKARSGYSILTEEYLTFQTVSPNEAGRIYAYNEQQIGFPAHCFSMFFCGRLDYEAPIPETIDSRNAICP